MITSDSNIGLPAGSVLHGEHYDYTVERILGQGSFGITYLASINLKGALGQLPTKMYVAIKEFYMRDLSKREGSTLLYDTQATLAETYLRKFQHEATNLSTLSHPGIVKVVEAFEENSTAYYVMEYIDGPSLDSLIRNRGSLSEEDCTIITRAVGNALSYMHSRAMLHLDLKPSNIMLRSDGTPIVIDFGLSKSFNTDGTIDTKSAIGTGTSGYSPIEQTDYTGMFADGRLPATMDVYALGATMYKMLTGQRPPEASIVLNEGLPELSMCGALAPIVEKAMEPIIRRRYQSIAELIDRLPASTETHISLDPNNNHRQSSTAEPTPIAEPTSPPPFINGRYAWDKLDITAFISNPLLQPDYHIPKTAVHLYFRPKNSVSVVFFNNFGTSNTTTIKIDLRTKSSDSIADSIRSEIGKYAAHFLPESSDFAGFSKAEMGLTIESSTNPTKTLQADILNHSNLTRMFTLPAIRTLLESAYKTVPNKPLNIPPNTYRIEIRYNLNATSTGPTPCVGYIITPAYIDKTYHDGFGAPISEYYEINTLAFKVFCQKITATAFVSQVPFPVIDKYPENSLEITFLSENPRLDEDNPPVETLIWRMEDSCDPEYGHNKYPLTGGNLRADIHQFVKQLEEIIPLKPQESIPQKKKKTGWKRFF